MTETATPPRLTPLQAADAFLTPRRNLKPREAESPADAAPLAFAFNGAALPGLGFGDGPAVLLLHGWEGAGADMIPLARAFAAAGRRAIVVDLPAHGAAPGETTSIPEFAAAIRAVAARIGPLCAVVAHSVGAAAATLALNEERFTDRAVLIGPPLAWRAHARAFAAAVGLGEMGTAAMLGELGRRGLELSRVDGAVLAPPLGDVAALILHSSDDRIVAIEEGRALAAAWPGARLQELEGLGHVRPLRDREVAARAVGFVVAPHRRALARAG